MDAAGLGAAEVLASNRVRDHTALAESSLLARGRRRIAVIGGALRGRQGTDRQRTDGHRAALTAAGVPFDPGLMVPVNAFHWQDGADAATRLMQTATPPDALLCLNDNLALGALRALYETGCGCPARWTWSASTTSRPRATACPA
nr:substrate-binding domain-containing protein [Streptomyces sp. SLBN-31]